MSSLSGNYPGSALQACISQGHKENSATWTLLGEPGRARDTHKDTIVLSVTTHGAARTTRGSASQGQCACRSGCTSQGLQRGYRIKEREEMFYEAGRVIVHKGGSRLPRREDMGFGQCGYR